MEGLSLRERQRYCDTVFATGYSRSEHRSPRLPTPETSRSSYDHCDSDPPSETMEDASSTSDMLSRPLPLGSVHQTNEVDQRYLARQRSRNHGRMYSPPYRNCDVGRPSLPPLKTVSQSCIEELDHLRSILTRTGLGRQYVKPTSQSAYSWDFATAVTARAKIHYCCL